jgi:sigma-B regulation protein RsbU (phosphoserine phosphatase)
LPPLSFTSIEAFATPLSVLVVDDSRAQRKVLSVQLSRWGYTVVEAASGDEALALCREQVFDMVLSDWMMPGMTGLDFCKAFRALPHDRYGYFILLTSKSEKAEIADGLQNGADDFLTKPVGAEELRARLRAGERIVGMQAELVEKNRLVGSTLEKLQKLYDSLDRDLIEARKLQQTWVRDRLRHFGRGKASLLLRPAGHVGGDLVGSFFIDENRVAIFSVDVSGHGVASAMMTARLAGFLTGTSPEQDMALRTAQHGRTISWTPEAVALRLNKVMIEELQVDQYFTMAYAEIDLATGAGTLVQAGHPHPMIIGAHCGVTILGSGGLPIGLIDDAQFPQVAFQLAPGDRLFLMSDGVTECPDIAGEELGTEGLERILRDNIHLQDGVLLEALVWELSVFAGGHDFPDDVSGILFDYLGPDPASAK